MRINTPILNAKVYAEIIKFDPNHVSYFDKILSNFQVLMLVKFRGSGWPRV